MADTQYALPSISNTEMSMKEQRELLRYQVIGQIASAWLTHCNSVLQHGLPSIKAGDEAKKNWFVTVNDLKSLIDELQEAMLGPVSS